MNAEPLTLEEVVTKKKCEADHLFFTRWYFKLRQNLKFKVNWHHVYLADEIEKVIKGETQNLLINVAPGSSKTEEVVINLIARGLAINPWARFLHISYSDDLALLNSQTARDLIRSEEYQRLWPLDIAPDSKAKNRWNVMVDGRSAGGVYAVSLLGQITGFRAGHMAPGFQGALIIDDPLKPKDAYSKPKIHEANRTLLSTVKSRKANPKTPIIMIMQRIAEEDPSGFVLAGNLGKGWKHVCIPAILTPEYIAKLDPKYQPMIDQSKKDKDGRCSYWEYKEPIVELCAMETGEGQDSTGAKIGRHVYSAQYNQNPIAIGGNIIKGEWFERYKKLPQMKYRKMFVDTAQKVKKHNDFSVFEVWGLGADNKIYLLDLIKGKWEAPELRRRAIEFWNKHLELNKTEGMGALRKMVVEDKSSGTGLIQDIRASGRIPIEEMPRHIDKLTRVMDVVSYIESKMVCVPEDAHFTADFITECEAFTPDDTHAHDDQIDPMTDAINDMLSTRNKIKIWESLGK